MQFPAARLLCEKVLNTTSQADRLAGDKTGVMAIADPQIRKLTRFYETGLLFSKTSMAPR